MLDSGRGDEELGTTAIEVETTLSAIFKLASHWKAILLLDEADVFVEQRETTGIHRNALVCVFLRMLEYYEGILFLTMNRVKTIDEAIASRIHLALKFNPLDRGARRAVWKNFWQKAVSTAGAAPFRKRDLDVPRRHRTQPSRGECLTNLVCGHTEE